MVIPNSFITTFYPTDVLVASPIKRPSLFELYSADFLEAVLGPALSELEEVLSDIYVQIKPTDENIERNEEILSDTSFSLKNIIFKQAKKLKKWSLLLHLLLEVQSFFVRNASLCLSFHRIELLKIDNLEKNLKTTNKMNSRNILIFALSVAVLPALTKNLQAVRRVLNSTNVNNNNNNKKLHFYIIILELICKLKLMLDVISLIYKVLYVVNPASFPYWSVLNHFLGFTPICKTRINEELNKKISITQKPIHKVTTMCLKGAELGALSIIYLARFLEWWRTFDLSSTASQDKIPSPPGDPYWCRKILPNNIKKLLVPLQQDPTLCSICRKTRTFPACVSSGYVYCYKCIAGYVEKYKMCPVTGVPVESLNCIRRLVEEDF